MSLNFTSNPTNGEVYDTYVYDSTRSAWILNDTFNLPDQIAVLESQIVAPIEYYIDGIVKGDQQQIDTYIAACLAVKEKYPNPSV